MVSRIWFPLKKYCRKSFYEVCNISTNSYIITYWVKICFRKDIIQSKINKKSLILFKLAYQIQNVWCTDLIICKVYLWCDSSILGKLASRTVLAATVVLELWLKLYNLLPQPENENFQEVLRFQYFFYQL